ncbi:unnamed protein product, partial [Polarella glacialis]
MAILSQLSHDLNDKVAVSLSLLKGNEVPDHSATLRAMKSASGAERLRLAVKLLTGGVEVSKYSYYLHWLHPKLKILRLSEDRSTLVVTPKRLVLTRGRIAKAVHIPITEISGVVQGAYTSTFKSLRAASKPPHWAAFSIIGACRTFDFSAEIALVVEACVLGLQQ